MIVRPHAPAFCLPALRHSVAGRQLAGSRLAWGIPLALTGLVCLAALHAVHTLHPSWVARIERYLAAAPATTALDPPPSAAAADPPLALFTPEVRRWASHIERWAADYALPPELVATVMQIESCGAPGVHSPAGAAGLFQVMPFHFQTNENPLDVETNAARGLAYLAAGLERAGGRADLALAGYNGGHGLIDRDPAFWPEQTQRYVHWGTGILNDAALGRISSPTLQAWLDAGGAHLCQQAAASSLAAEE